jgi:hypothetical protein
VLKAITVGPSVGGSPRDFDSLLNPSTKAFILVVTIVAAPLRSEFFAKPIEQATHLFLAKPLHLPPRGHYGGFEFFLVQFSDFSIRLGWLSSYRSVSVKPYRL